MVLFGSSSNEDLFMISMTCSVLAGLVYSPPEKMSSTSSKLCGLHAHPASIDVDHKRFWGTGRGPPWGVDLKGRKEAVTCRL